jgi:exonuclease III
MFNIVHWNSFKINQSNILALESFLNENKTNLFFLNETKIEYDLNINGYESVQKNRDSCGGGVAILVKNGINYKKYQLFDKYNLELVCVEISIDKEKIYFISMYLPPHTPFPPNEFFCDLNKLEKFILVGDLNCKSTTWYSSENNTNGIRLEEQIEQFNFSIVKNKKPTYYNKFYDKFEILDLALCSSNLIFRIQNFNILSSELISDHFPLYLEIENFNIKVNEEEKLFKQTNWENFTCDSEVLFEELKKKYDLNLDSIQIFDHIFYDFKKIIQDSIQSNTSIKKIKEKKVLPLYLIKLLKFKKNAWKKMMKNKCIENKKEFNFFTKLVKSEIIAHKSSLLEKKIEIIKEKNPSETDF